MPDLGNMIGMVEHNLADDVSLDMTVLGCYVTRLT